MQTEELNGKKDDRNKSPALPKGLY
jgi:hypothetical protein